MFTIFVFIYLPYKTYFKFSTCFTLIFFYYHLCWCSFAVECLCYHSLEPWFHTFYFLCVELAGILSECYVILFPVILLLYSLILLYSLHSLSFFLSFLPDFPCFFPRSFSFTGRTHLSITFVWTHLFSLGPFFLLKIALQKFYFDVPMHTSIGFIFTYSTSSYWPNVTHQFWRSLSHYLV